MIASKIASTAALLCWARCWCRRPPNDVGGCWGKWCQALSASFICQHLGSRSWSWWPGSSQSGTHPHPSSAAMGQMASVFFSEPMPSSSTRMGMNQGLDIKWLAQNRWVVCCVGQAFLTTGLLPRPNNSTLFLIPLTLLSLGYPNPPRRGRIA